MAEQMKFLIYCVTFLAYLAVHMMRMGLPFVQMKLQKFFMIHNLQMGIANACLYIVIGVSSLLVSIRPVTNPQFRYFWSMSISNICFLLIPILVYLNIHIPALFYLSLAGFGWFQSVAWPILLATIRAYFSPEKDGCLLGFWSGNKDLGNVFGFLTCTVVIIFMNQTFQLALLLIGIISVIFTFGVYMLKIDPEKEYKIQQHQNQSIKQQYLKLFKDKFVIFMLIMLCMLKAIIYGILLWLPMYFDKEGFKQYQGYIPIAMNLMGVVGSVVLGFMYQKISSQFIRAVILMLTLIVMASCFYVIRHIPFTTENKLIILILIAIIGFCVTGNFNILIANQVALVCDRLDVKVIVFSSLTVAISSIFVGIVQIIIGRLATQDSNSVFLIYFVMAIALIVFQIIRQIVTYYSIKNKRKQTQAIDQLEGGQIIDGNQLNEQGVDEIKQEKMRPVKTQQAQNE